ncbi:hypothetical protein QR685DRAFT_432255, partial [Neurospora intermedia]
YLYASFPPPQRLPPVHRNSGSSRRYRCLDVGAAAAALGQPDVMTIATIETNMPSHHQQPKTITNMEVAD